MATPFDAAQETIDGANQVKTIMKFITENTTRLQQEIETLDNDRRNAQQETSTAQEEALSMREELVSARQEIQRLNSQLGSEKTSNRSLRQRLRELGDKFASYQNTFRAGYGVFSSVYQTAQRLVSDTDDTRDGGPEGAETLAVASQTEQPLTSSSAPALSAPTSPASNSSSLAEAPTPSASTESTLLTIDTNSTGSIPPTGAQAPDVAVTSRGVATVDCYAVIAHESGDSGVPLATQTTAYSSLITKPAQRFRQYAWKTRDLSDSLKRNLDSLRHKDLNNVSQILLECAHSGTSGVIYEATNNEQISGITIAATNLAIQIGENHGYMKLLADQHKSGYVCPSAIILTSSGELASQMYTAFASLVRGNGDERSVIDSIKVAQSRGGDGKSLSLADLKNNLPTILVCTPGRLTHLIQQAKFKARLLHLLVVCQGPSLASVDFASEMQNIFAWARCERSSSTGTRPASAPAPCPLTTIVLSRSFERDSKLHQELKRRYINKFIRTTNATRWNLGKHGLLDFKGEIKVQVCAFNVPERSKHFIEKILPLHRNESILCMEFSQDRAEKFASQCRKSGVPGQVFTTESENSKTIQQFRDGKCEIMFTTPAGFEGIRYRNTKTAVIFGSPCESLYINADGSARPAVYRRRTDLLRAAIESVGQAGQEAKVYIFVGQGTGQSVKDDIAKVLGGAGYEVPRVLKP